MSSAKVQNVSLDEIMCCKSDSPWKADIAKFIGSYQTTDVACITGYWDLICPIILSLLDAQVIMHHSMMKDKFSQTA